MVKRVSNMNELAAAMMPYMEGMIEQLEERVYQTLNYYLQEYYNSYSPEYYRRQYDLLRLAVKVEPKRVGNRVVASVYIDYVWTIIIMHLVIRLLHGQIRGYMVD